MKTLYLPVYFLGRNLPNLPDLSSCLGQNLKPPLHAAPYVFLTNDYQTQIFGKLIVDCFLCLQIALCISNNSYNKMFSKPPPT